MPEAEKVGTKSLYLDADVWLNLFQGEMLGFVPAFQRAELLLSKAEVKEWGLVVSDLVREEVRNQRAREEDMERKLSNLVEKNLVKNATVKETDREKAERIREENGLHLSDALHAAVALRKRSHFVTRNIRHFSAVSDILNVSQPEELLRDSDPPGSDYKSEKSKSTKGNTMKKEKARATVDKLLLDGIRNEAKLQNIMYLAELEIYRRHGKKLTEAFRTWGIYAPLPQS